MENFSRACFSLWAKKEEKESQFYWLPLPVHLEDTMHVSKWLWMNWLSESQREFCIRSISVPNADVASNLAAFLGAVHDIGKATPAFQIQKGYQNSPDLDGSLLEKLERAGFRGISSFSLTNREKTHHSIAGEFLLKQAGVKNDISSIVGGHHGKPIDNASDIDDQSAYMANYYQSEDISTDIFHKWEQVQSEILHWALKKTGFDSVENLPELSLPAQVIYSGLLIMADWISSNTDFFPLLSIDASSISDSFSRYQTGVTKWGKNLPLQIQSYPSEDVLFQTRFGFQPRDFQRTVCHTVSQIKKPGIMILEAPMGLGKTEAALAAAEEVAAKTGSSGLFFGLPTQATSNGMFGRVKEWLENLAEEYGMKQSLQLCHGKAALNKELNQLKKSTQDVNIDDVSNGSVYVNEWFSGRKKTSLDDCVVGTVDGFLLTALKQKHLALRHLGFSKKVVIIDEVHAYDTYMQQYLDEAIRWMGAYQTPVILVSATLPQERRKALISAYLKGMGAKRNEIKFPDALSGNSYPLISYSDGKEVKGQVSFQPTKNKVISVVKINEEVLLEKVEECLEDGGVAGIIVNTVRKAQHLGKIFKEHFGAEMTEVLHSAYIATDRVEKEKNLISMIGKHGNRPEKKIIIGTQVMEQSLDIDFDVLFTDLCPIDLLLQRIGRMHRHEIERPEKLKEPSVYVMGTSDQLDLEKGSVRVYGEYILIRTQYFLPDKIRIPSDIPVLINDVYGDKEPAYQGELLNIYQNSRSQMEIQKKSKADKAYTYRIENPRSAIRPDREKYNLIGWLKFPDESLSDEMASAQVRDIQETIEIVAVKKIDSGYGTFHGNKDISGEIEDVRIAKELAKQTIRLPHFVTMKVGVTKTIDFLEKYNLKYLAIWQEQPWLKGALGIIFDENGSFDLCGVHLKYDMEFGLREVKDNG